ncbi:MAG: septation regulator SpoVG [Firmicutes bacterium]|nr:septation regulator SpoVG [Bacillota bacterium]
MEITDIRVKKVASEGKMKAVASVTFDNAFVVHDIKIIEGQEKLFTAMPSRKTPENEFKDIAHPINSEMRAKLENAIIAKYNETLLSEE